MAAIVRVLLRMRALILILLACMLVAGTFGALQLDVEAYPDPSPPLVEIITQNPAWSAEEMEQQVTAPIETAIYGVQHLDSIRSISIFGLSDVKLYFTFNSDYFHDRQEVLDRLQLIQLPTGLEPELSPWSPIGEIFRYQLTGPYTLNDLTATQDWLVRRELKQVPGIIDITTFGGAVKQYQIEADPQKLLAHGVTLPQLTAAVQNSNANAGGNYISLGEQSVNVRAVGQLHTIADIEAVVVATNKGVPVLVGDVATVKEGSQQRLGKIGRGTQNDIVEGIVLLNKDEESIPALEGLKAKIYKLNHGLMPPGMKLDTISDRTNLIDRTEHTVKHVIITGLVLVTLILLFMLGDVRTTIIAAATIPFAVLFAFSLMAVTGHSANLISIGAIDFGILVDASIVVLENIHRKLSRRLPEDDLATLIIEGVQDASRPVLFSTAIILVAFIPLFTMEGVPGKIFAPMSVTYGFALIGALLFGLVFAPVLAFVLAPKGPPPAVPEEGDAHAGEGTWLSNLFRHQYNRAFSLTMRRSKLIWITAGIALIISGFIFIYGVGGEFMPPLEEGNLWVRATLPQDVSYELASKTVDQFRAEFLKFPEVKQVVSQVGRPNDGTDVTTFNNLEFLVDLKDEDQWPKDVRGNKDKLISQMQHQLSKYPGAVFGFSQQIQDDLNELSKQALLVQNVMERVPGVQDVGIFKVDGQPSLVVRVDRTKASRYGIAPADVNAAIQAAVGGSAVTQLIEGDRRFDVTVRYPQSYRNTPDSIGSILLPAADGSSVPLSQVADIGVKQGSFQIYREAGRRYIPIKFSVRGRDLAATITDLQAQLTQKITLPSGYTYAWAGEFDSLKKEQKRLALIIPVSLLAILILLYTQFNTWLDAFIVLATLPFAAIGGILALLITHTAFSISAAVGFTSLTGVATLGAVVFLSGIRRAQHHHGAEAGLREGSLDEMRPVLMACMSAGLGLLPAAISNGIGAQAQQPLARVVVGGMLTTVFSILLLTPLMARRLPKNFDEEHL
jgi:cobalt-zinc-cadmium resistance protein CzcA